MSFISEMFKSIFRTFGRIIAYAIIGMLIYFIASKSVDAQGQYRILNRNSDTPTTAWANISFGGTTYENTPIILTTNGKTIFQLKDTTAFASGKKYDLKLNFDYYGYASGSSSNVDVTISVATEIYNGSTLVSISDKCVTNYYQESDVSRETIGYTAMHRILGTITCTGVDGAGYYPYFGFQIKRGSAAASGKGTLRFISWDYHLNTSGEDTQNIINNQNNNTQSIINNQNYNTTQITGSIDSVNDTLTDSSIDSPNGAIGDMSSSVATNGTISTLILLPITLYQSVLNNINGTCSPFTLGTLYGTTLTLPCINISTFLGSALYGVIDVLISGFFILAIRKKFVDIFNHLTNLRTGDNELE